MEEKNDFSDLILDDSSGASKAKKLLLNTVVVVIIVLIAMIGYRIFSSDNTILESQNTDASFTPAQDDSLSNTNIIVQEDNSNIQTFDDFKASIEQEEYNIASEKPDIQPEPIPQPVTKPIEPIKQEPIKITQNEKPAVQTPPTITKDPFDTIKPIQPTKIEKTPTITPKQPTKNTLKQNNTTNAKSGKYVQVLANTKLNLDDIKLKKLRKLGIDFIVYDDPRSKMQKALVGPLSGNELDEKIKIIRKEIVKDAFIFTIK